LTDELLKWRSEFPILDKTVYLISHSLGAMPRATYDRLHEYADVWASRGVRAWAEGWWDAPVQVGDLVGKLLNAPPGTVVMHMIPGTMGTSIPRARQASTNSRTTSPRPPRNGLDATECAVVFVGHRQNPS